MLFSPRLVMQKKYAILLLGCFVLPLIATYAWLRYERKCVKRQVKQEIFSKIDLKDCSRFEFTLENEKHLEWEHSAEFTYKGQKYDVILKKKTASGTTIYYCWKDVKESAVEKKIAFLVNRALGGNPGKDKQHKSVTHLAKDLPEETFSYTFHSNISEAVRKGGSYRLKLSGLDPITLSPPPETGIF